MASPTLDQQTAASSGAPRPPFRIEPFRPENAAAVAAMFNESEEGWPGGFTRGVPMTAESVLRMKQERQPLALLIAWEGETAVGYCNLYEEPDEPGTAGHIGLLNVPGRFQGRGYGRELLKAALRETVRRGYRRLDLGTWPGNMKAVPLYKKSGYFWVPETTVHMQNYLPLLLAVPILADFWRECDWYQAQVRDLSVQEDLYLLGKMRVFPYEFRHGDRYVKSTIDVASQDLTALETERWRIACTVDDRILAAGRARTVRWEVENRTGRPLPITVLARAGASLQLTKEVTVLVDDLYTTEAALTVGSDYQPPVYGTRPPGIQSVVLIDGYPLRLHTGVEVRPPVDLHFEPRRVALIPGRASTVALQIRNNMDEPATVHLSLAPSPSLAVLSGTMLDLPVEAEGYAGHTLEITAAGVGAHSLELRATALVGDEQIALAPRRLSLPAVAPGQLLALTDDAPVGEHRVRDREVRVESSTHRLVVSLRSGRYSIEDAQSGAGLLSGQVLAGPPFGWTYQARVFHEANWSKQNGALTVTLRGAVPHLPDAAVEHALTLHADGLVSSVTSCTNMGAEAARFQAAVVIWTDREATPTAVLPTIHGLVCTDNQEFPDWTDAEMRDPALYDEGWMARQGQGRVAGLLWSKAMEIEAGTWSMQVTQETPLLAPGAAHTLPPVYLLAGWGDWRAMRACWRRLLCPAAPEQGSVPRNLVTLTGDPAPTVLAAGSESRLTLSSLANRAEDGTLLITAPLGWEITPTSQTLSGLRVGNPRQATVQVRRLDSGPGAVTARARWHTERAIHQVFEGALIALGSGTRTLIHEESQDGHRLICVNNGFLRFRLAPAFIGSVVALETVADGVNHLHSAFPTPREFGWIRPWFGGMHAVIYRPGPGEFPDPARLHEETFVAEEVSEAGHDGRPWHGVQVKSTLQGKGLRGLELRASYLTTPGSNLLAVRLQVRNLTTATLPIQAALVAHLQPGGAIEGGELLETGPASERLLRAQRTEDIPRDGWVGVRNPRTGTTMALAAGGAPEVRAYGVDWGILGAHAGLTFSPRLGPGEERSILSYLAVARDEAEARAYRALAGTTTLL